MSSIQSLSFRLRTRLSKNEIIVRQTFDKFSLGSDYPIFTLDLSAGVKGIFKNDYEYYRLEGTVMWDIGFPPIGTSKFALSGGKIFGKVPYPLLKLHEGNATYFYDPYAFS